MDDGVGRRDSHVDVLYGMPPQIPARDISKMREETANAGFGICAGVTVFRSTAFLLHCIKDIYTHHRQNTPPVGQTVTRHDIVSGVSERHQENRAQEKARQGSPEVMQRQWETTWGPVFGQMFTGLPDNFRNPLIITALVVHGSHQQNKDSTWNGMSIFAHVCRNAAPAKEPLSIPNQCISLGELGLTTCNCFVAGV